MAVTVVNNNQLIHNADDITLWLANGAFSARSLVTLGQAEGTGAVEARSPNNGGIGHVTWDGTLPDFTNKHLIMWVFITFPLELKANGGLQIILSSAVNSLSNFGAWNLLGSDFTGVRTYAGWNLVIVDCNRAFDEINGTPPALNAVASMGQRTELLNGNGKTVPMQDAVWWADTNNNGLTVTGGTNVAPATFAEIAAADKAGGYGVLKDVGTIYFVSGKLRLGDGGTATSIIRDSNKIVVFEDQPVSNTHYILENVGNATAADNEVALNSFVFKSAGPAWQFDAIDANLNICDYTDCTIDGATQGVNWTNVNANWVGGTILNSGAIKLGNSAEMRGLTISATTEVTLGALHIQSASDLTNVRDVNHKTYSVSRALYVDAAVTAITLDNHQFDNPNGAGAKFALFWAGTVGTLTLTNTNGTNLVVTGTASAGGTVVIPSSVPVTVTVLDDVTSSPINVAHVQLVLTSDHVTEVMSLATNASGIATNSWTGALGVGITGWVRQMDLAATDYVPADISGTITAAGFSLTVRLTPIV